MQKQFCRKLSWNSLNKYWENRIRFSGKKNCFFCQLIKKLSSDQKNWRLPSNCYKYPEFDPKRARDLKPHLTSLIFISNSRSDFYRWTRTGAHQSIDEIQPHAPWKYFSKWLYPFPGEYFKINNKKDNSTRFISYFFN